MGKLDSVKGGPRGDGHSPEAFARLAIVNLRKGKWKGIHSVYNGFNEAYRQYFVGRDPVGDMNTLCEEGKLFMHPTKGGVRLYLPEDGQEARTTDMVLASILGALPATPLVTEEEETSGDERG